MQHIDDGVQTETDSLGGKRKVYQDHFKMDVGLTVKDWRSTCRIANIDVSNLSGDSAANLVNLMREAYYKVHKHSAGGNTVIYCNSNTLMYFDKQVEEKTNIHFSYQDYLGKKVLTFRGIPIRECDQILDSESRVV